ncbi:MAG: HesA/MoeB/ThiF family protein [Fimbriimonadaceae bacterium]|nr:HesA/MoeB/ThiF family protein [Fimbriimonadaceae bacterium]
MEPGRYQRFSQLPEIGESGIARLQGSSVLIVGAGGLGCPAALYLCAAGIGKIALLDDDSVSEPDLGRQVLYGPSDMGIMKVVAAQQRLAAMNPDVQIEPIPDRLTRGNAEMLLESCDVVIDGTDSLGARRIINLAAISRSKPAVFGGAVGWTGFVQTYMPGAACYDCVWTDRTICGSCAEVGVLGPLVGTIGTIQASEAIKVLLGVETPLASRLMLLDLKSGISRNVDVRRRPECPACGAHKNAPASQ